MLVPGASWGRAGTVDAAILDHSMPKGWRDMARRYHEDSRASAELDPVFRKLWEDGAKDELPRAEAWLREAAPAITARLGQPG